MAKEYQKDEQIEDHCEACGVLRPQIDCGLGVEKQATPTKCPCCVKEDRYGESSNVSGKLAAAPREPAEPYVVSGSYEQGSVLQHPLFGRGEVVGLIGSEKMEVLFRDRLRCLVHSRVATSKGDRKQ